MNGFVKYEKEKDRVNQRAVAAILQAKFDSFPVVGMGLDNKSYWEFKETPVELNLPQDFDIKHHGRNVAVAEVKCRNPPYDLKYIKSKGMLITTATLTALREQHHNHGRHVLIVSRTSDMHILYVSMQTLMINHKLLTIKADGCLKTDHGTKEKKGTGTIIPFSLLKEIKP